VIEAFGVVADPSCAMRTPAMCFSSLMDPMVMDVFGKWRRDGRLSRVILSVEQPSGWTI